MPSEEAFDYLATQAIADYLASEAGLDGIVFPSAQTGHAASNVVLFHHASRVEEVDLPKGTEVTVRTEQHDDDGVSPDYWVWEEVPPPELPQKADERTPLELINEPLSAREEFDPRPASLRIDLAKVVVHHIRAVAYNSVEYPVNRHRSEKRSQHGF